MATSGSVDYSVNRNEIITEALELLNVLAAGDTADANDVTSCARTLNMMVKHWQALGVTLWKNQEVYVFLADAAQYYDIGPSGDNCTTSFTKTELAADAAASATTLTVDSISGISDADVIGIELDSGDLHWDVVNGSPSGTTVTLTTGLASAASEDGNVFAYTSLCNRPLYITEARLHLDSGTETPVHLVARNRYKGLSTKTSSGKANMAYYDPQLTDGRLYVWPTPDSVKDYLVLTCRMPVEDFDAAANDPDFPQEWLLPLAYNLAVLVAPKFGEPVSADFAMRADRLLFDASSHDMDNGSLYIGVTS